MMKRMIAIASVALVVLAIAPGFAPAQAAQMHSRETFNASPKDVTNQRVIDRQDHENSKRWAAMAAEQLALVNEAIEEAEVEAEAEYYEEWWDFSDYAYTGDEGRYNASDYGNEFKRAGIVYDENGTRFSWYSQRVLPGGELTELNNNGRHVGDNGFIYDGDGYIAVGSDDTPQGEIVDTPWGKGRVYDSGNGSGQGYDVYTDF